MPRHSETLKDLGFSRARDLGMSITHSPNVAERGMFYNGGWAGAINTTAVDENGDMWVKAGEHINLASHGFKQHPGQETIH